jgi:hypothetical protein
MLAKRVFPSGIIGSETNLGREILPLVGCDGNKTYLNFE